jgi:hypothetical protein
MKERRIILDEFSFTNLCKFGFIKHISTLGTIDLHITKKDIIDLYNDQIVIKEFSDEVVKVLLTDLDKVLVKEIIRRSPVFSELYYQL